MKKARKLTAVLLSLVMLLALVVPASAAENYSITIHNDKTGHIYEAYQIFAGTVSDDETDGETDGGPMLGDITWGSGVDGGALLAALNAANAGKYGTCTTAADVAKALGTENATAVDAAAFADIAAQHLTATVAGTATAPNDDGNYIIQGLPAGYYLVKDQDGSLEGDADTATDYIVQVLGNVTMEPKDSDIPTLEKQVYEDDNRDGAPAGYYEVADHEIGENFYFKLIGSIPDMGAYDTYTYTFHDTMSAGLSLTSTEKSNFEVFLTNAADADLNDATQVAAENYVVNTNPGNGESFTVSFSNLKSVDRIDEYDYIVVRFSAYLNQNAVVGSREGNPNEVYLEFSNNPTGEGTGNTEKEYAIVFTYRMNVQKVDENRQDLAGAKFALFNSDMSQVAIVQTANPQGLAGGDLVKWVAAPGNYETMTLTEWQDWQITQVEADSNQFAILQPVNDDTFVVEGLDHGTYKLFEIEAPEGYNKLTAPAVIVITSNIETNYSGGETGELIKSFTASVDTIPTRCESPWEGNFTIEIVNRAGATLPETGGMGTTLFYIIGGLLVVGAGILLVVRIRMKAHNE